ncbi:MAG: sulfurtransferase, partial [Deltaproteobacteria bacterium]
ALAHTATAGEVFVSPAEARQLIDAGATVIDARGDAEYRTGHIPGSVPLSWLELRDGWARVGRLTDDMGRLQEALQAAGVDDDRPVLVYDAGIDGWGEAGRIWWTLEYLGHDPNRILDGGLPAWIDAGGELTTKPPPARRGDFIPHPDETLRARLSEVERDLAQCGTGTCDVVFWDTREPREYAGATPYGEPRGGHLPGAVGLYFKDLLDARGRLRPEPELRATLQGAGITPDKRIVPYCTGGVRSGFAVAVLTELGYPRVANYDGSMWEWTADDSRPVE